MGASRSTASIWVVAGRRRLEWTFSMSLPLSPFFASDLLTLLESVQQSFTEGRDVPRVIELKGDGSSRKWELARDV